MRHNELSKYTIDQQLTSKGFTRRRWRMCILVVGDVHQGVHVDHGVHVDGDVGSDLGDDVVHVDHESCHWTVFETLFETLEYVLALVALVAERKIGKMAAAAQNLVVAKCYCKIEEISEV